MNALVIEREGANRRLLTQLLEKFGYAHLVVDWPYRGVDYVRVQSFDLCVINVDRRLDLKRLIRVLSEQNFGTQIIFVSEKRSRDHYNELIAEMGVKHLVAKSLEEDGEPTVAPELFEHTLRHIVDPSQDWGLKGILPHAQVQQSVVLGTHEKSNLFNQVERFAQGFNLRDRMVTSVLHLCDELVMNVIFNAPHDVEGNYLFRQLPRESEVKLSLEQQGYLEYAFDGQFFGLSAVDPFGSLTVDMVRHYLTRSYREYQIAQGQEGGGMGFLNMFAFASYFEVFVVQRKLTRVTVLINAKQGFKHARSVPRSLNFLEAS
jgi:CheY-like chemotaxis protein